MRRSDVDEIENIVHNLKEVLIGDYKSSAVFTD